jgi:hypothetical protein
MRRKQLVFALILIMLLVAHGYMSMHLTDMKIEALCDYQFAQSCKERLRAAQVLKKSEQCARALRLFFNDDKDGDLAYSIMLEYEALIECGKNTEASKLIGNSEKIWFKKYYHALVNDNEDVDTEMILRIVRSSARNEAPVAGARDRYKKYLRRSGHF